MRSLSQRDKRPLSVRWWPLVPIGLVGGGTLYAVQVEGLSVLRPALDFTIAIGIINLAVYVWVRVFSRLRGTAQIATIGGVLAIQGALLLILRPDGFAGDGRIVFAWRWTPTPEERLIQFVPEKKETTLVANLADSSKTDSPAFRGADRAGRYRFPELDFNWNDHPPQELWRRPIGRGWSSFAVVGEYCVTQEQRDQYETVVCYELSTGDEVWRHQDETRFNEITSGAGPRATPTIHEGRVYTFGATGILNCIDGADGCVAWSRKIANVKPPLFGYVSSPLVYGQHLFITPGGKAGSLLALDRETGETVWSHGSRKAGYSSPQLFPTRNEDQILVFDATGLHGHDSVTGTTRWSFLWGDNSDDKVNVCQPCILSEPITTGQEDSEEYQMLISSGYGRGSALISVIHRSSGEWTAQSVWHATTLKSKFSDVIVHHQHAYGLDEGILTCISLADGTRRWKNGRYGYGQLILVNDMLMIQTELGRIVMVKADPSQFVEVAALDALSERTWNQPVVAGRFLLVRNDREAVCYELP